jgi:RNA polymerase sigma-70 factor (ECF subfamily)
MGHTHPLTEVANSAVSVEQQADFETAVLSHLDELYACALRFTRHPADAQDLVQETVLRAFAAFDRFEPGSNSRAWLYRILTNAFISNRRRKEREPSCDDVEALSGLALDGGMVADAWAEPRSLETALTESSMGDEVVRALDALPDDYRLVVVLCDLEGLSYKEIAQAIQRPIGTVMSRLHRGRKLLQSALTSYARELGLCPETASRPRRPRPERDEEVAAPAAPLALALAAGF